MKCKDLIEETGSPLAWDTGKEIGMEVEGFKVEKIRG